MSDKYLVIGAEMSPFSVKVRSYLRFKSIPHQWLVATADTRKRYQNYSKIPIIPLVITPNDQGVQDSTPIIENLETLYPENSIHPQEPAARFISQALEEFGDEWANKWMFHLRWARQVDQLSACTRLAKVKDPQASNEALESSAQEILVRMKGRVWFVGSNEQNASRIEAGFEEALHLLEHHFLSRLYLFGSRPSFGDFGLWSQIYNAWTDPTGGALINAKFPSVLAWIHRMHWPRVKGDFESWNTLSSTLMPFLSQQLGAEFLPWTLANFKALQNHDDEFSLDIKGQTWTQKPQKYHAKSLLALQKKYHSMTDKLELDTILEEADCLQPLREAL